MSRSVQIHIISGKIGSGKTTLLQNWLPPGACGILSPKINGKRVFQNIESGEQMAMENAAGTLETGRYRFDATSFVWAQDVVLNAWLRKPEWLIIDEIGPLEIRKNQGFHELLVKIFSEQSSSDTKILIVVRDFMVQEFCEKYGLQHAVILPETYFRTGSLHPLTGVVLCGGESSRMKQDKALIRYDELPQWKKVCNLLQPFCDKVVVSVNEHQWHTWANEEEGTFITDHPQFAGNGPLTGLLTVATQKPGRGLFVIAIDYPMLKMENLISLFNERTETAEAVCFLNGERMEPLISIIEKEALHKLTEYHKTGGNSVNRFLQSIHTIKVPADSGDFLTNINSREEFLNFNTDFEH